MRISILFLLMLFTNNSYANTQYSREQCQLLNQQRKAIRHQLRQPYTAEQGLQLQAKEQALLKILQLHCKNPRLN